MAALGSTLEALKERARRNFGNRHREHAKKELKQELKKESQEAYVALTKEAEATELLIQNPNHAAYFKLLHAALEAFEYQRDTLVPDTPGYSEKIFALVELTKFTKNLINQPKNIVQKIQMAKKSIESTTNT